jgi:hypothetical protein
VHSIYSVLNRNVDVLNAVTDRIDRLETVQARVATTGVTGLTPAPAPTVTTRTVAPLQRVTEPAPQLLSPPPKASADSEQKMMTPPPVVVSSRRPGRALAVPGASPAPKSPSVDVSQLTAMVGTTLSSRLSQSASDRAVRSAAAAQKELEQKRALQAAKDAESHATRARIDRYHKLERLGTELQRISEFERGLHDGSLPQPDEAAKQQLAEHLALQKARLLEKYQKVCVGSLHAFHVVALHCFRG